MKINYPAVIVATLVHFILGGIWYSLLFANKFIQLMGWTKAQLDEVANQSHAKEYLVAFLSSLVLVYILAHFVQYTKASNAIGGLQTAFWLWLGVCRYHSASYRHIRRKEPGTLSAEHRLPVCGLRLSRSHSGHLETSRGPLIWRAGLSMPANFGVLPNFL